MSCEHGNWSDCELCAAINVLHARERKQIESLTAERDGLRDCVDELLAVRDRYGEALCRLATLGNEPYVGNSQGNRIAADALAGKIPAHVPAQEPVAWRYQDANGNYRYRGYVAGFDVDYRSLKPVPLYGAPPAVKDSLTTDAPVPAQVPDGALLWRDMKTDSEKANYILSGRAYATGILAHAIQNDVAMAYQRCANYAARVPAQMPDGYAGAMVWVGPWKAAQIVSEVAIRLERDTGNAITEAAQRCLDMLAAAQKGEKK